MKKIISLFLFTVFFSMNTSCLTFAQSIPSNTPVVVRAAQVYDSGNISEGDTINFIVASNIVDDMGKILIESGTTVSSNVIKAKKRGRIGKPGKIVLGNFYTISKDGTKIPLSGEIKQEAKSKMGLSVALSVVIIPFFLLMRGENTQIHPQTQYTLYTVQ